MWKIDLKPAGLYQPNICMTYELWLIQFYYLPVSANWWTFEIGFIFSTKNDDDDDCSWGLVIWITEYVKLL